MGVVGEKGEMVNASRTDVSPKRTVSAAATALA